MSEPTDQNQSDPIDDKELSALYARGSTEQPPDNLDQVILNQARRAISQQPTKPSDSRWSQAISMAAVLVMSVTVVMLVHKEAPQPLSDTSQLAMAQKKMTAPIPTRKPTPQPAKRLFEKQKKEIASAESRMAPMALQDSLAPAKKEANTQGQTRAKERTQERAIAASPVIALSQKALKQNDIKQKDSSQNAPAQETLSQRALSLGTISLKSTASGFIGENILRDTGKSCSQLTEQECFTSAACTLTKTKDSQGYQCRPANDHCELMFRQSEGTEQSCEAKQGCVYVPANCYCPPGTECRCAGGEPAQCRSTTQ